MTRAAAAWALLAAAGGFSAAALPAQPREEGARQVRLLLHGSAGEAEGAAVALGNMGERGVDALVEALAVLEDRAHRRVAAHLLARLAPPERSRQLARLASDPDAEVRLAAAEALARRDQPGWREHQALRIAGLAALLEDEDARVARAAAEALSWHDEPEATEALAGALSALMASGRPLGDLLAAASMVRFAGQPSARPLLPALVEQAARQAPGLLPALLGGMGSRLHRGSLEAHLAWLGHPDPALRRAAEEALEDLDSWLFRIQDHEARLEVLEVAERFAPRHRLLPLRRLHVALLDALEDEAARALASSLLARPFAWEDPAKVRARAEVLRLHALERFLDGRPGEALRAGGEALVGLRLLAERDPFPPRNGVGPGSTRDLVRSWEAWRARVDPPPDPPEINRFRRGQEAMGGARVRELRATLREEARTALLLAGLAAADPEAAQGAFVAMVERAHALVDALEREWWEEDELGPSREWDTVLGGRAGVLEFLTRALENRKRLEEAERIFHLLLEALHARVPEVFPPRPADLLAGLAPLPGPAPAPVARERILSDLLGELARFYERIGENGKAAVCHERIIARLEGSGLSENRFQWAQALFSRGNVALEQRDAPSALAALERYIRYYESRRVDVEQRPDFYFDPEAARRWFERRLSHGYVSLAVLHNVILGDTATAREHCRRAWELEDSPFNRVLYACYLARDGRGEEALALAGAVEPIPEVFYNLACTYALAGKREEALEWLERDLSENHATPRRRNLQRTWARKDRDLESLWEDPAFQGLVAPEPEEGR